MFIFMLFTIIIFSVSFCYMFYRILEIEKDIDCLYDNYSREMEKNIKTRVRGEKKNVKNILDSF